MKKIFFALAAMAMVVFASCSKDEDSEPSSSEIQLDVTVVNIGPDEPVTRTSIKDVWDIGDQIYIWYDSNQGYTPDLVITYDGNEWVGPEDITAPSGESGYVKCVYDGRVKVASKVNYTYTSSPSNRFKRTFSFNIDSWTCLTELVVVVTDIPKGIDAFNYILACDKFTPLSGKGYTVGSEAITATTDTKGDAATGFASYIYDNSAAFAFATSDYSGSAQDFKFTLANASGTRICSENITLEPSTKIQSITLAYSDFAAVSPAISFVDANFKAYCVAHFDTNGDGEINSEEAQAVTAIDCSGKNVASLVGIEHFSNLETLDCSNNTSLTTLDVSGNTSLTTLDYDEGLKITSGFEVGRYIQANGVKGVAFNISGTTTKIMSIDETYAKWADAKTWCSNKGYGWYLPSKDELLEIYNNKSTLNATLSTISGATQLGTGLYWSSTTAILGVMYVDLLDGGYKGVSKYNKSYVRAVRAL